MTSFVVQTRNANPHFTMETITNITNAAAKAVWGETEANKEPISGVEGNTAKGEPFDAGNLGKSRNCFSFPKSPANPAPKDTPAQEKVEHNCETNNRVTGLGSTVSGSSRVDNTSTNTSVPTATSNINSSGITGSNTDHLRDNADTTTSTTTTNNNKNSTSLEDATAASALPTTKENRDTTAGQNDTHDPDKVNVDTDSNKPTSNTDDVDTSPGTGSKSVLGHEPRTIAQIAKSKDGDAGRDGVSESSSKPSEGAAKATGEGAGLGATSSSKEGEDPKVEATEPVHTTGLAADGGNFDASKPGAGQEAERTN